MSPVENATLHPSFVSGDTALCPYNDATPKLFERWFADQDLVSVMGDWEFYPLPYYEQTPEEYVKRTRRATWLVCAVKDGQITPIGYTGLYIQPRHRVGILRLAIAERDFRAKGHGQRATALALQWAFRSLDLITVHLSMTASNTAAVKLYEKAGFRECGRFRMSRYSPEGRFDEILMDMTKDEWLSLYDTGVPKR